MKLSILVVFVCLYGSLTFGFLAFIGNMIKGGLKGIENTLEAAEKVGVAALHVATSALDSSIDFMNTLQSLGTSSEDKPAKPPKENDKAGATKAGATDVGSTGSGGDKSSAGDKSSTGDKVPDASPVGDQKAGNQSGGDQKGGDQSAAGQTVDDQIDDSLDEEDPLGGQYSQKMREKKGDQPLN